MKPIDQHGPLPDGDISGPALRTFRRIAAAWELSADQQRVLLGEAGWAAYQRWAQGRGETVLSAGTLARISCVFGIYEALHTLFPDDAQADSWPRRPNAAPMFIGQPAIERMLAGTDDLMLVRRFLDAQCGLV